VTGGLGDGRLAALGAQSLDVGGQAGVFELREGVRGSLAHLDFSEEELAEVEADRRLAPEAEVDEGEPVIGVGDEQVACAGVAVGWR
jgi:hypothetical protein